MTGEVIPSDRVIFGEISLSGAIRPVTQPELRLKEAEKLGFSTACVPYQMKRVDESGISVRRVQDLPGFVADNFPAAKQ